MYFTAYITLAWMAAFSFGYIAYGLDKYADTSKTSIRILVVCSVACAFMTAMSGAAAFAQLLWG